MTITFDESGNTYSDLLNKDQPVFVLASCNHGEEEAENLLKKYIYTHQTIEAKFSKLKKNNAGQERIIKFLSETIKSPNKVKVMLYHKQYMVVTKIVDILIEELYHKDGIDLYKNGKNIFMSNVFFHCTPVCCGRERTLKMYQSFIDMIMEKNQTSISNFYYAAWQVYSASIDEQYQSILKPILATELIINNVLQGLNSNVLNPIIPCFFYLCDAWGRELNKDFDILHDESSPLSQEKETLEAFMSKGIPRELIGYDIRKFELPLRASGINFADSKKGYRLQVADLLAGSFAYWAKGLANNDIEDNFWKKLNELSLDKLIINNAVWFVNPSDISSLGKYTDDGNEINPFEYMKRHIKFNY